MGDGYYDTTSKCIIFCTDNFTKKEVELLSSIFLSKFNINSILVTRKYKDKNDNQITHYRLKVIRKDTLKLMLLMKPYIIPCMQYKCPLIEFNNDN